jgi:hypothetical protein
MNSVYRLLCLSVGLFLSVGGKINSELISEFCSAMAYCHQKWFNCFFKLHFDKFRQANFLQNEDFETSQAGFVAELQGRKKPGKKIPRLASKDWPELKN